jgi:hypothetical protein
MLRRVDWQKFADVSGAFCAQTTRRNIPEDSPLQTRRPENLKNHLWKRALKCARGKVVQYTEDTCVFW